ncbi:MAG: cobyric acid synthase CobQ, partial [Alicyclobacillaceae bacterium]|nr:cobyric acid synthase CobQ [Alicyclobacillaceae bacterium]
VTGAPFLELCRQEAEGPGTDGAVSRQGRVWGTYVHGIFDRYEFRRRWLNCVRRDKGLPPLEGGGRDMYAVREEAFDRLADLLREHVDWDRIYALIDLPRPMRDTV